VSAKRLARLGTKSTLVVIAQTVHDFGHDHDDDEGVFEARSSLKSYTPPPHALR
jgi:hypothetical protein